MGLRRPCARLRPAAEPLQQDGAALLAHAADAQILRLHGGAGVHGRGGPRVQQAADYSRDGSARRHFVRRHLLRARGLRRCHPQRHDPAALPHGGRHGGPAAPDPEARGRHVWPHRRLAEALAKHLESGKSCVLYPGGIAELFLSSPQEEHILARKGFISLR